MNTHQLSVEGLSHRISHVVEDVRSVMRRENGEDYDAPLVEDSIRTVIANKLDRIEDGLLEMLTTPGRGEFYELSFLLEEWGSLSKAPVAAPSPAREAADESVFAGYRPFSQLKLAAMMEYLAGRGQHVYKTSLNKLLFYSDLSYFYLTNNGISGAIYYNRPFGPVADAAEPILNELIAENRVAVDPRMKTLRSEANADAVNTLLSDEERKTLDWVYNTYGGMNAGEISDVSHLEMAYKNTEPNEPIAYKYAQFLKHLPPKDLLSKI